MLFRTVYGPELEAIYTYLATAGRPLSRENIHRAFMPTFCAGQSVSPQNVDDALSFLVAAHLIHEDGRFCVPTNAVELPFRLLVLRQLRCLTREEAEARHSADRLYMLLLDELFIKLDRLFVADVHAEANKLRQVKKIGGLSKEKLQAWKRVMTFLGVGQRVDTGFQCAYAPDLLLAMLDCWSERAGLLQTFFDTHLASFLPFETQAANLAQAVSLPMLYLAAQGELALSSRQDSPSKPYFGEQRFRYIARLGGEA
jgi:hypothetical protein